MSLAVCEVKCWENRLLAEKTGPLSCQVYSSPVYRGCRHIFCIVSHFLFGRICVLHTSKELDPNHYNETFSIRNRHDIINYRESIWLFHHGFGNAVKIQYQLVSRRRLSVWSGTVSDNHHSKKEKSVVVLKFLYETEWRVDFIQCSQEYRGRWNIGHFAKAFIDKGRIESSHLVLAFQFFFNMAHKRIFH